MAGKRVEEVVEQSKDSLGEEVRCFYAKNPPEYLVYRNDLRVMVHFADDSRKARRQRLALAALNPLRGQISGLIDGWHGSDNPRERARAARYDRRVADAVIMGLEGSVSDALALLTEIRDAIIAERKSIGRTDYLMWAAGVALCLIVLISALSAAWFDRIRDFPDAVGPVWTGAAGGTIGAFFSIATGLRSRTVLVDLQQWDNRRDAILRVAVGTIGGAILVSLFLTGLVSAVEIDDASLRGGGGADAPNPVLSALVIGFIAGFSERAVPDLLAKANVATDPKEDKSTDVAADQARAAGAPGAAAAAAAAAAADDEEDEVDEEDACLSGAPPVPGERTTDDEDLPPATGGVADLPGTQAPADQPDEGEGGNDALGEQDGAGGGDNPDGAEDEKQ